MQLNYYSVLGVKRSATPPELKAAYKKLAIQFHPDKHKGDVYFEEQFKKVNEAYQILSDPHKRRVYDLKLDYVAQQQRMQRQTYATPQRRPSSVHERHYRPITKTRKFSRRDWQITIGFFLSLVLIALLVNAIMNGVAANVQFRDASAFMQRQQWASAHSSLSEAIRFKPEFTEAYLKRGFINQTIYQDYETAIEDFSAALTTAETPQAETYLQRGKCYANLHLYQRAEADFTAAIKLDKNLRSAYFSRGELRLLDLNAWQAAIKDLSFYLEQPQNQAQHGKALYYRGFAYYLTDNYQAAITDFEMALKTDATNGQLYYLLGKSEYALNQKTVACRHFAQAYALGYKAAFLDWQNLCNGQEAL